MKTLIVTLMVLAVSTAHAQSGYYGGKYYGAPPSTHTPAYNTTRAIPLGQGVTRIHRSDSTGRVNTETLYDYGPSANQQMQQMIDPWSYPNY